MSEARRTERRWREPASSIPRELTKAPADRTLTARTFTSQKSDAFFTALPAGHSYSRLILSSEAHAIHFKRLAQTYRDYWTQASALDPRIGPTVRQSSRWSPITPRYRLTETRHCLGSDGRCSRHDFATSQRDHENETRCSHCACGPFAAARMFSWV